MKGYAFVLVCSFVKYWIPLHFSFVLKSMLIVISFLLKIFSYSFGSFSFNNEILIIKGVPKASLSSFLS